MKRTLEIAAAEVVEQATQNPAKLHLVVTANDNDSVLVEECLRQMAGDRFSGDEIAGLPAFVQTGVYRFESVRRLLARRLGTLHLLRTGSVRCLVVSASALLRIVPSSRWLAANTLELLVGAEHDQDAILDRLLTLGYQSVQRVEEVGECAVRGGILDFWTPGERHPVRCEFFADTLEKIRLFRPADQRSFDTRDRVSILPSREFVWPHESQMGPWIDKFNKAILAQGLQGSVRNDLLENVRCSIPFPGVDDLCSLFADTDFVSPLDYIHSIFSDGRGGMQVHLLNEPQRVMGGLQETIDIYENAWQAGYGKSYMTIKPEKLFPTFASFQEWLKSHAPESENVSKFAVPSQIETKISEASKRKFSERLRIVSGMLLENPQFGCVFTSPSQDSCLEFVALLRAHFEDSGKKLNAETPIASFALTDFNRADRPDSVSHWVTRLAKFANPFFVPDASVLVLPEEWLRGVSKDHSLESYSDEDSQRASREAAETLISGQFGDFAEGDLVVHVQHGIARFRGLTTIRVLDISGDFLVLEYAGNDKVYVPVHKLNLVQRYIGSSRADDAQLDSLKGTQWEKRKARAKEEAAKVAKELLEHQAKRATTPGHAYAQIEDNYLLFEAAFPYDETPDQLKATREIQADMTRPKAMDRLLCGDVGFGKTEVAMRAAYRAVLDGKQVSWLVPTTVLAHQHFRSLQERFGQFGVNIEILDRSSGAAGSSKVLRKLQEGGIDIIVGTHRLLSPDVKYRDLGLLIVDEEQRFGVLQKEKIKTISYGIDVLTMSATPIPRTLQMAMIGLRELSLLTTPPKARLAVKTFVCPFEESTIRDAIKYELARAGQVFFVHNKVEDLASVEVYLKKLVPEARVCIGHGKMAQKELDKTVIEFIDQKFDVLLCTTIIESGIDMPNVNTIIVQDADHFGLSQLYQLRGRVGRRSTRGYAYFLMSPTANEKDEGVKRLEVLREHQELGSGFVIASQDLEMRGAGNIMGDDQSGRVTEVGLETYLQMLDDAIRSIGGRKVRPLPEAEIQIPVEAQIPEDYVQNARERLRLYRRFFGARNEDNLAALTVECADRFGPLPETVQNLADMARIRRWLMSFGGIGLNVSDDFTEVKISPEILQARDDQDAEAIVRRIFDVCNREVKGIRLTPDGRLLLPLKKRQFRPEFGLTGMTDLKKYLTLFAGESYVGGQTQKKN
ncbi:MAG: transcription-repair coupling factor [Pseudomonadota bacterium]|jgi:transcription-repair coupling factor (superfamily II helicase)